VIEGDEVERMDPNRSFQPNKYTPSEEHVETFRRRWHLDVTVDVGGFDPEIDDWYGEPNFDPVEIRASFMAAAEAASRSR